MRAMPGLKAMAIAITAFVALRPSIETTSSDMRRLGIAMTASTVRIISSSTRPPRYADPVPDQRSRQGSGEGCDDCHRHGRRGTVQNAGKQIAAEMVGTEEIHRPGWAVALERADRERVARREPWPEQHGNQHQRDDRKPDRTLGCPDETPQDLSHTGSACPAERSQSRPLDS